MTTPIEKLTTELQAELEGWKKRLELLSQMTVDGQENLKFSLQILNRAEKAEKERDQLRLDIISIRQQHQKESEEWKSDEELKAENERLQINRGKLESQFFDVQGLYDKSVPERAQLRAELDKYKQASGFCTKHKPDGGSRNCLVCGCEELSHALSKISYLCGNPNQMGVSEYDVYHDPELVISQVTKVLMQPQQAKEDKMKCAECGELFNPANLDEVLFHETHKPFVATGIKGEKVSITSKTALEWISAHEEYENLLTDELNDLVGVAAAHGWKSTRFEAGEKLRSRLADIKKKLETT